MQSKPSQSYFYSLFRMVIAVFVTIALVACGESNKAQLAKKGTRNHKNVKLDAENGENVPALTAVSFLAFRQVQRTLDLAFNRENSIFFSKDCARMLPRESDSETEIMIVYNGRTTMPNGQMCSGAEGKEFIYIIYNSGKKSLNNINRIVKKSTANNLDGVIFSMKNKNTTTTFELTEDILITPSPSNPKIFSFSYNNVKPEGIGFKIERQRRSRRSDDKNAEDKPKNENGKKNVANRKTAEEKQKEDFAKRNQANRNRGSMNSPVPADGSASTRPGRGSRSYVTTMFVDSTGEIDTSIDGKWKVKFRTLRLNFSFIRPFDQKIVNTATLFLGSQVAETYHELSSCLFPVGDFFAEEHVVVDGKGRADTPVLNLTVGDNNLITLQQNKTTFNLANECVQYDYNSFRLVMGELEKQLHSSTLWKDYNPPRKTKTNTALPQEDRAKKDPNKKEAGKGNRLKVLETTKAVVAE